MRRTGQKSAIASGALALLAASCLPGPAQAAERITLANGFDLVCHHHQFVDGKVRIYLKASQLNSSQQDYFELNPDAIAAYETVPDPVEAQTEPVASDPQPIKTPPPPKPIPSDAHLTAEDLHQLLSKTSAEHHLDEDLLASVVKAESGGYARAVSRAGARGLMQLMPGTARQLGIQDSFAPDQNVQGGTAYLDALLTRYRDNIPLALAAYNAGPEAVDRYRGIPPYRETQAYVARVIHEFNRRVLARRSAASAHPMPTGTQIDSTETTKGENAGTGRD